MSFDLDSGTIATTILATIATGAAVTWVVSYLGRKGPSLKEDIDQIIQVRGGPHVWHNQKVFVVVNPFGGNGKGKRVSVILLILINDNLCIDPPNIKQVWETQAKPVLTQLKIDYELVFTTHAGHARTLMIETDWKQYGGIIVLSGDGMLHECINSLFEKCGNDVSKFKSLNVGLFIIPTGTCNGYAASLGGFTPEVSLKKLAAATKLTPVDLYQFHCRKTNTTKLDIHCISHGIVADHDQLTERELRHNPFRMALAPLTVIGKAKSYPSKLYIKPVATTDEETRVFGWRDGFKLPADDKGRSDWRKIECDFVLMTVINSDMASHDMSFAPGAKVDDGNLYVLVVRKGISRITLIRCFLAFADGSHIKFDEFEIYKASSVEYRPKSEEGNMNVSGEQLPVGPTDVEVLPRILKFVV
ncbi:UNVERIFIED_CONTAM: Sphingosine kinase 1 [Siphonaria sp. JEL0065]|nr:Sphingosine kinase 1 [Siphonaria sp. JEL0065]